MLHKMLVRWGFGAAAALGLLAPAQAWADWREAQSDHFVIYADDDEKGLTQFARQLEQFHKAMGLVTGAGNYVPSPSNRVTVYLVSSEDALRRLFSDDRKTRRYVGGFYVPRPGGSAAFLPRLQSSSGPDLDWSMVVLLHEYAHHFLISGSAFPMPRWYSEGAAEFFAAAKFDKKGSVGLGQPAMHRAGELFYAADVTATDLLDPEAYEKRREKNSSYDAFYGKSWLLYHYLTFEPARKGQLKAYIKALVAGKPVREAGLEAFGDFKVLEQELDKYLKRPRMMGLMLKGATLEPGPIKVRLLGPGEAAVMPVVIQSRRGVDNDRAAAVLAEAKAVAARFPKDPAVLAALAEAEVDSGDYEAAVSAADAALAADPTRVNAHVQKGLALFRKAEKSQLAKDFSAAKVAFVTLNRQENDHPLPLIYYYRSFVSRGQKPTPLAIQGLEQALALAPFDLALRMNTAMQQLRDGRPAEARANLQVVAYASHGGKLSEKARRVIERMAKDPAWRGEGEQADDDLEDGPG